MASSIQTSVYLLAGARMYDSWKINEDQARGVKECYSCSSVEGWCVTVPSRLNCSYCSEKVPIVPTPH
jgi:hypothetical protein